MLQDIFDRWERERIERANHGPACETVWFQRHETLNDVTAVVKFKNNQYFWKVFKRIYKPSEPIDGGYENDLYSARANIFKTFESMV